jgi:hypothetical protein
MTLYVNIDTCNKQWTLCNVFKVSMRRINSLYQQVLPVWDLHLFLANITLVESTTQTAAHKVRKKVTRPFLSVSVPQRRPIRLHTIRRLTVLGLETAFVLHKFHVPSILRLNLCGVFNFHAIVTFVVIKAGTKWMVNGWAGFGSRWVQKFVFSPTNRPPLRISQFSIQ